MGDSFSGINEVSPGTYAKFVLNGRHLYITAQTNNQEGMDNLLIILGHFRMIYDEVLDRPEDQEPNLPFRFKDIKEGTHG